MVQTWKFPSLTLSTYQPFLAFLSALPYNFTTHMVGNTRMGIDDNFATVPGMIINFPFIIRFTATSPTLSGISAILSPNATASEYPFALVAGGSKGIGYALAEALAKRKFNLVLIARHMDSLLAAKEKLESRYGVKVELLQYDLSEEQSAQAIAGWCTENKIRLKVLCNVAGFGGSHDYLDLELDKLRYMVRLNVESAMVLSLILLPLLEKNAPSYILNVSSMAAFAPIPGKNMYSATKSALSFFSYSLRYQLKNKDISVSLLCPGPVYTKPEVIKDTRERLGWFGDKMALMPDRVGEVAVKRMMKGKFMIIPGTVAKLSSIPIRVLPTMWVVKLYGRADKKARKG